MGVINDIRDKVISAAGRAVIREGQADIRHPSLDIAEVTGAEAHNPATTIAEAKIGMVVAARIITRDRTVNHMEAIHHILNRSVVTVVEAMVVTVEEVIVDILLL